MFKKFFGGRQNKGRSGPDFDGKTKSSFGKVIKLDIAEFLLEFCLAKLVAKSTAEFQEEF